jgi:glycosyltransferase involved in cell wall biosynthesis
LTLKTDRIEPVGYESVGRYDPAFGTRMKIGMVTPSWPGYCNPNGIATTVAFLVEGLEALRHDVAIIPLYSEGEESDPRCVALPAPRPLKFSERVFRKLGWRESLPTIVAEQIAAAAQIAIRTHGIEVLVMEETNGWAGMVQRLLPIPVIMTLHGPWFLQTALQSEPVTRSDHRRNTREAVALRQCAGVTSPSRDVMDRAHVQVPGITVPCAVIPNPISIKTPVVYGELNDRQRKSILFVGRHEYRKGADTLLQSFQILIAQGQDAYLTFIGPDCGMTQADGHSVMFPQALAQLDSATQARITYLGPQSKEQIDRQRQRHALAVVASRYETFGYTVLEAMAAGSAVVSTAAGGPSEIIDEGLTGLLIPAADPAAMARACQRLLGDLQLAQSLGQAARRDVAARFAPERIAADLVAFCERVIREGRS